MTLNICWSVPCVNSGCYWIHQIELIDFVKKQSTSASLTICLYEVIRCPIDPKTHEHAGYQVEILFSTELIYALDGQRLHGFVIILQSLWTLCKMISSSATGQCMSLPTTHRRTKKSSHSDERLMHLLFWPSTGSRCVSQVQEEWLRIQGRVLGGWCSLCDFCKHMEFPRFDEF